MTGVNQYRKKLISIYGIMSEERRQKERRQKGQGKRQKAKGKRKKIEGNVGANPCVCPVKVNNVKLNIQY